MTNKLLLATVGVLTVGALIAGTNMVFAEDSSTNQQSLVQKLAARFSLNESDVQAVFDESRAEHQAARQAEMKAQLETRLNQAVTDGKITAAQKQLILDKHQEMQEQREADRTAWLNKTPEERRTAMEKRRAELEAWASTQGIDIAYLAGGKGGMMDKGDRLGMGEGRHGIMGEGRFDE